MPQLIISKHFFKRFGKFLWCVSSYNLFKVNEDKLRKILKEQIDSGNQIQKNYLLSEIFFNEKNTENLTNKYNQINESIIEIGFENTASTFSTSSSANKGGNIGWIKESQLSETIQTVFKDS